MKQTIMVSATHPQHDHSLHHHHLAAGDRLRTAFFLTLIILFVEAAAGLAAHSLALLADAGHILTDAFALGLAWYAARAAQTPPDERNTFGYHRSGILAALLNAAVLILIAGAALVGAVLRFRYPSPVQGGLVLAAATVALLVNVYIASGLRHERDSNLNIRAALLHVVSDAAASVAVMVGGILILVWHLYVADPILTMGIAVLIAVGAWQIARDTVGILMEGTPPGVDLDALRDAMREVPGVLDVHDLHVWALSDGFELLSAHVTVPEQSLADAADLVADLKLMLRNRFHIEHATIETECLDCRVVRRRPVTFHSGNSAG
jgi:cobalt-zinc-cadmium efflux system protein